MKRALVLSWRRGVASPAINWWKLRSKRAAHDGSSVTVLFRHLSQTIGQWVRGFGSTQIFTVTCIATTAACVPRPPRRDGNWDWRVYSRSLVKQQNLASKKSS